MRAALTLTLMLLVPTLTLAQPMEMDEADLSAMLDRIAPGSGPNDGDVADDAIIRLRPDSLRLGPPAKDALSVSASGDYGTLTLTYPWTEPVAAAAFLRGNSLYVVFEKRIEVNQRDLLAEGSPAARLIQKAVIEPHLFATVLRYEISATRKLRVRRQGDAWQVSLTEGLAQPRIELEPIRQVEVGEQRIFFPSVGIGPHVRVYDQTVGDQLSVVPMLVSGAGVSDDRRFSQVDILRSGQGLAIILRADSVDLSRYSNGLAIEGAPRLILSDPPASTAMEGQIGANPDRLVDLAAWRLGALGDYDTARKKLLYELSLTEPGERNISRWKLARFFLGHGQSDKATGPLAIMRQSDPDLDDNPAFRLVSAINHIGLRDFDAAADDLVHESLLGQPDADLWRARIAEARGENELALRLYRASADTLKSYDPYDRVTFQLSAARAALDADNVDFTKAMLSWFDDAQMRSADRDEANLLRGRLAELLGEPEKAFASYEKAVTSRDRRVAAWAGYHLALYRKDAGKARLGETIAALERLKFAWRGGRFELKLTQKLAQLYLANGQYRDGLETYRAALAAFPRSDDTRDMATAMSQVFGDLYLRGAAETMPPVGALALYYDFRELTPLGAEGDQMIRRLADRLVAVDLLDQGAELLEHQVTYRLEGAAQSAVASRLAKIHLLDNKPQKAIDILRITRRTDLPVDIDRDRRHTESRALLLMNLYEEAEAVLDGDTEPSADRLRSDIYWASQDWARVVNSTESMLGDRWLDERALTADERLYLLRQAVSLAFLDRQDLLARLRGRYDKHMADGRLSGLFGVLTDPDAPPGRQISELTRSIAGVDKMRNFMDVYREEFVSPLKGEETSDAEASLPG